jgi:uncharacterized protein (DUF1697 family)
VARSIALLRAVNVGGRKMPMAELRAVCAELGWTDVETYIQSGNILFAAPGEAAELETSLEEAVQLRFGYWSDVIIRSAEQWRALLAASPFVSEAEAEPNRVLVGIAKTRLQPGAAAAIQAKAAAGERVAQAGEALWFHYPAGVGTSKLTPSLIDRSAGSPVTARNWRTMLKLGEMAGAPV